MTRAESVAEINAAIGDVDALIAACADPLDIRALRWRRRLLVRRLRWVERMSRRAR